VKLPAAPPFADKRKPGRSATNALEMGDAGGGGSYGRVWPDLAAPSAPRLDRCAPGVEYAAVSSFALGRQGAEETKRERLGLLAELHDPLTDRQLDSIGVAEGWRCLGCRSRSVAVSEATRSLADRLPQATFDLAHARCLLMRAPSRLVV
jgi:hypothetical protein